MEPLWISLAVGALSTLLTVAGVWAVMQYRVGRLEREHTVAVGKIDEIAAIGSRVSRVETDVRRIDERLTIEETRLAAIDNRITEMQVDIKWIRRALQGRGHQA